MILNTLSYVKSNAIRTYTTLNAPAVLYAWKYSQI